MRNLLPAILILFYPSVSNSQIEVVRREVDSLHVLLAQSIHDTLRLRLLQEVVPLEIVFSADTATREAVESRDLAMKIGSSSGVAKGWYLIGSIEETYRNYYKAMSFYQKAIEHSEKYLLYQETHEYYSCLLNLYFYTGDYPKAMDICVKGLELSEKHSDVKKAAHYYGLFGFIYASQGNRKEAENYYRKYLQMAESAGDSFMMADAYSSMAGIDSDNKKYENALSSLNKALIIYSGSWQPSRVGTTYFSMGNVYKSWGNLDKALEYSLAAISHSKIVPANKYDLAAFYAGAGEIFRMKKEYAMAVSMLKTGLQISAEIGHAESRKEALFQLSQVYSEKKRYDSAYVYYTSYANIKDSLINEKSRQQISEIHTKYQVEKKDAEINSLNKEKQLIEEESENRSRLRNLIIGFFILLIAVFFLLYNRYQLREKNRYQLKINQQQNELFTTTISTQDKERKRIAEDLHDGLGSILSTAKLQLARIEEQPLTLATAQEKNYRASLELIDEAIVELRNISHNIMPAALSTLGLVAALKNLFGKITSSMDLKINFSTFDLDERLEEPAEISIYNIIFELVNNIIKHADAGLVTIQMIKYPDYVNIIVEDDGKGFNYNKIKAGKKGIGLDNIASRVDYMKGKFDIDAEEGRGTIIIIEIPLKKP